MKFKWLMLFSVLHYGTIYSMQNTAQTQLIYRLLIIKKKVAALADLYRQIEAVYAKKSPFFRTSLSEEYAQCGDYITDIKKRIAAHHNDDDLLGLVLHDFHEYVETLTVNTCAYDQKIFQEAHAYFDACAQDLDEVIRAGMHELDAYWQKQKKELENRVAYQKKEALARYQEDCNRMCTELSAQSIEHGNALDKQSAHVILAMRHVLTTMQEHVQQSYDAFFEIMHHMHMRSQDYLDNGQQAVDEKCENILRHSNYCIDSLQKRVTTLEHEIHLVRERLCTGCDLYEQEKVHLEIADQCSDRAHECTTQLTARINDATYNMRSLLNEYEQKLLSDIEELAVHIGGYTARILDVIKLFEQNIKQEIELQFVVLDQQTNTRSNTLLKILGSGLKSTSESLIRDINAFNAQLQEQTILVAGSLDDTADKLLNAIKKSTITLEGALATYLAETLSALERMQCLLQAQIETANTNIKTAIALSKNELKKELGKTEAEIALCIRKRFGQHDCLMSQQHGQIREDISVFEREFLFGINRFIRCQGRFVLEASSALVSSEARNEAVFGRGFNAMLAIAALILKANILLLDAA